MSDKIITPPSSTTLKKYGLSESDWWQLYNKHQGKCHVCLKETKGRLVIEHEHVKNWKKMPPEQRRLFVRGLADWICNFRILTRGVTLERLRNAVRYLEEYEKTKQAELPTLEAPTKP